MLWNMQDAVFSHSPGSIGPFPPGWTCQWEGEHQCPYRDWCSRGAQVLCVKLLRKSLKRENMDLCVLDSRGVLYQ